MLITRESDYALRLLRTLRDGEQYSVGELARREMVPQPFAYKIVKKLSAAGMVQVSRGAEGGCRLTADLTQTTLYDLLRAMEEDSNISSCMEAEYACPWRAAHGGCSVHARLGGNPAPLGCAAACAQPGGAFGMRAGHRAFYVEFR